MKEAKKKLKTATSFIETTGVACSDSVCHNRVQVLSIPVYYSPVVRIDVVRSSVKVPEFNKHLKKAGGHIGQNVVEITIKMKTIVQKTFVGIVCYFTVEIIHPFYQITFICL